MAADNTGGAQAPHSRGNRNAVAAFLRAVGDMAFAVTLIGSVVLALYSVCVAGEAGFWASVLPGVIRIMLSYLVKILFHGLAELIQIAHDIRQELRDMRKGAQSR